MTIDVGTRLRDCTDALRGWFSYGHLHGLKYIGIPVRLAGNSLGEGTIRHLTAPV